MAPIPRVAFITDTFTQANGVALTSRRPAVLTDAGGPRFIVREGVSGSVGHSDKEFVEITFRLPSRRAVAIGNGAGRP